MKAKSLNWILGFALTTVVLGIGAALYTGHLAVVSTRGFVSQMQTDAYSVASIECQQTTYRTFNAETEVITGHSSGLPSIMSGGVVIRHANLVFDGKKFVMPPLVQWWGNTSYRGRSLAGGNEPNWVTFKCLENTTS